MNEQQATFFRYLCAPFAPEQVKHLNKKGVILSYITSRTLYNRLDEVCGPTGWYTEFFPRERGYTCRLHLRVPNEEGKYEWMYKEEGGGYAGMSSEEDDEKSGYSDAAKRAGMAWGIARYLYGDGVPAYLGEAPPIPEPPLDLRAAPAPAAAPAQPAWPMGAGAAPTSHGPAPSYRSIRPGQAAASAPNGPPAGTGGRAYDNFRPPRAGGGAFAWGKHASDHFGADIVKFMETIAQNKGYAGARLKDWPQEQLDDVVWAVIREVRTWPNYQGEFEHLMQREPAPAGPR
jgi:hypothetical protein